MGPNASGMIQPADSLSLLHSAFILECFPKVSVWLFISDHFLCLISYVNIWRMWLLEKATRDNYSLSNYLSRDRQCICNSSSAALYMEERICWASLLQLIGGRGDHLRDRRYQKKKITNPTQKNRKNPIQGGEGGRPDSHKPADHQRE